MESPEQLTHGQVAALEESVGAQFPDDYRKFLMETNGGRPARKQRIRDLGDAEVVSDLKGFFGERGIYEQNLKKVFAAIQWRMPKHAVPIAFDSGGNFLLLDCQPNGSGAVYFLDSEEFSDAGVEFGDLIRVAHSFSHFLEGLEHDGQPSIGR